jgi:hypothetical protein
MSGKAPSQYCMTGGIETKQLESTVGAKLKKPSQYFMTGGIKKIKKSTENTVGVITIFRKGFSKAKRAA